MHTYTYEQFWGILILLIAIIITTLSLVILFDRKAKEGFIQALFWGVLFLLFWQIARFLSYVAYTNEWVYFLIVIRYSSILTLSGLFILTQFKQIQEAFFAFLLFTTWVFGVLLSLQWGPKVEALTLYEGLSFKPLFYIATLAIVLTTTVASVSSDFVKQYKKGWNLIYTVVGLLLLCILIETIGIDMGLFAISEIVQLALSLLIFYLIYVPGFFNFLPQLSEHELRRIKVSMLVFKRDGQLLFNKSEDLIPKDLVCGHFQDVMEALAECGVLVQDIERFKSAYHKGERTKISSTVNCYREKKDYILEFQPLLVNKSLMGYLLSAYEITEWNRYISILKDKTHTLELKGKDLERYHENAGAIILEEERNKLLDEINGVLVQSMKEILSKLQILPDSQDEINQVLDQAIQISEGCLKEIRETVTRLKRGEYDEGFNR